MCLVRKSCTVRRDGRYWVVVTGVSRVSVCSERARSRFRYGNEDVESGMTRIMIGLGKGGGLGRQLHITS